MLVDFFPRDFWFSFLWESSFPQRIPATCDCTSRMDLLWQWYALPHWDWSCRSNSQSQYTDMQPTSTSAYPISPGAVQGSHWSTSVSHKDQLKGSLGPSTEILKGPFQILRVPMMQEQFYLKQRSWLIAFFFFFVTRAVGSHILLASVSDAETWYTSPGQ